jgi:hypothetical protein
MLSPMTSRKQKINATKFSKLPAAAQRASGQKSEGATGGQIRIAMKTAETALEDAIPTRIPRRNERTPPADNSGGCDFRKNPSPDNVAVRAKATTTSTRMSHHLFQQLKYRKNGLSKEAEHVLIAQAF